MSAIGTLIPKSGAECQAEEINDFISHIATTAEQQSVMAEVINRDMSTIAEVIRQLIRNGEETVVSSALMQQTYHRLREIVRHCWLESWHLEAWYR